MTLPSAADTTIFFLDGVFLFGSLKNCRINKETSQRGRDHKLHMLKTKAEMATEAIKNGQPSFAMMG